MTKGGRRLHTGDDHDDASGSSCICDVGDHSVERGTATLFVLAIFTKVGPVWVRSCVKGKQEKVLTLCHSVARSRRQESQISEKSAGSLRCE